MLRPVDRPLTAGRESYLVVADAFIISAALFLLFMAPLMLVFNEPSMTSQLLGQVAILFSGAGGPLLAWILHANRVRWLTLAGLLLGLVAGGVVVGLVFGVFFFLGRFVVDPLLRLLPGDLPEGPWGLVVLATIAVLALLAVPVFSAVRDLAARPSRRRVMLALVRLGLVILILAAVIVTVVIGGETAEVGLFMVMFAASGAAGAAGIAWLEGRRRPSAPPVPPV